MNRRTYLANTASLLLLPSVSATAAQPLSQLFRSTFGAKANIQQGRVQLQLPALAENGNSVRLTLNAPISPTSSSRLLSIQVFAPLNPQPFVAKFHFGELAAKGEVQTRIRVAADQAIAAVASYSDGSFWSGSASIVVTEAACLDALY